MDGYGITRHLNGYRLEMQNPRDRWDQTGQVYDPQGSSEIRSETRGSQCPEEEALNNTLVNVEDEQVWLYRAVNPETCQLLQVRPNGSTKIEVTKVLLRELAESPIVRIQSLHSWRNMGTNTVVRTKSAFEYETFNERNHV